MKLIMEAIVESIASRQDRTIKVTIGTQEVDSDIAAKLFHFRGNYIKLLISDSNISPMEEALIDETKIKDGRKVKTKSQRLRAVLYRLWEQNGSNGEFDLFYDNYMEGLIENIKSQLDN